MTTIAPKFARGVVTLTIDGQTVELRCTPAAAAAISKAVGGLQNALNKVVDIDFDVVTGIFAAASGRSFDEARGIVFANGITDIATVLYRYTLMLLNGGRTEEERKADAEEATKRGNAPAAADPVEAAAS